MWRCSSRLIPSMPPSMAWGEAGTGESDWGEGHFAKEGRRRRRTAAADAPCPCMGKSKTGLAKGRTPASCPPAFTHTHWTCWTHLRQQLHHALDGDARERAVKGGHHQGAVVLRHGRADAGTHRGTCQARTHQRGTRRSPPQPVPGRRRQGSVHAGRQAAAAAAAPTAAPPHRCASPPLRLPTAAAPTAAPPVLTSRQAMFMFGPSAMLPAPSTKTPCRGGQAKQDAAANRGRQLGGCDGQQQRRHGGPAAAAAAAHAGGSQDSVCVCEWAGGFRHARMGAPACRPPTHPPAHLVEQLCLRIHQVQRVGQVVGGLEVGEEGGLDGDGAGLDAPPAQVHCSAHGGAAAGEKAGGWVGGRACEGTLLLPVRACTRVEKRHALRRAQQRPQQATHHPAALQGPRGCRPCSRRRGPGTRCRSAQSRRAQQTASTGCDLARGKAGEGVTRVHGIGVGARQRVQWSQPTRPKAVGPSCLQRCRPTHPRLCFLPRPAHTRAGKPLPSAPLSFRLAAAVSRMVRRICSTLMPRGSPMLALAAEVRKRCRCASS